MTIATEMGDDPERTYSKSELEAAVNRATLHTYDLLQKQHEQRVSYLKSTHANETAEQKRSNSFYHGRTKSILAAGMLLISGIAGLQSYGLAKSVQEQKMQPSSVGYFVAGSTLPLGLMTLGFGLHGMYVNKKRDEQ